MKALLFLFLPMISFAKIQVAITIDDLPHHGAMSKTMSRMSIAEVMLKHLKEHKVPEAYGFINAAKLTKDPASVEVLKLWRAAGHPLANHTASHPDLNKVSVREYVTDIDANEATLNELNGKEDWHYFRYPYLHEGNTKEKRQEIRKHLAQKNYVIAPVTIDFNDWAYNGPYARCSDKKDEKAIASLKEMYFEDAIAQLKQADEVGQKLYKRQVAQILLMHVGGMSADTMGELLSKYESLGVEFITLKEALKDPIYKEDPGLPFEWDGVFFSQIMEARKVSLGKLGVRQYPDHLKELEKFCL